MPVKAISLRTGLLIPPSLADFNTYLDKKFQESANPVFLNLG